MLKKTCLAATATMVAVLALSTATHASEMETKVPLDPFEVYGEQILFDVYRKGKKIGTHEVVFRRDGEAIIADSSFSVRIPFIFFNYDYDYTSSGRWENGKLVGMTASVNDDGDVVNIDVSRTDEGLLVKGPEAEYMAPLGTYPTTHWNSDVLGSTKTINTITGKLNEVTIVEHGIESVRAGGSVRVGTHYQYQGELTTEVWYDAQGRWIKMRFDGKDGTPIEYRCIVCSQTVAAENPEPATPVTDGDGS